MISRTLKFFNSICSTINLSEYLDSEATLVIITRGMEFLEYISDVGNNDKSLINLMKEQLERDRIVHDIFRMFALIITYEHKRFKSIYKNKKLKSIIFYFLIDSNHEYQKKEISESLTFLTKECNEIGREHFKCKAMPGEVFINILHKEFLPIVLDMIYNDPADLNQPKNKKKSKKYEEVIELKILKSTSYFNLLGSLIKVDGDLPVETAEDILTSLLNELRSLKRIEFNEESDDKRLASLINLIGVVFNNCPDAKQNMVDHDLFNFVLKDCLFRRRKDKGQPNFPVCKSDETREKCYKLLLELMDTKENKFFSKFAAIVTKWMQRAKWRTSKGSDWDIKKFEKTRMYTQKFQNISDYTGLENLGCT